MNAEARYQGEYYRFTRVCPIDKQVKLVFDAVGVFLGYFVFRLRKLRLAEVDGLVCTVYQQVYLRPFGVSVGLAEPAARPALHTGYTQGSFYLA